MAGTGSTGIIACYLNRKAILIDLEQKFVDMMKKNIERFKKACKFWKVKRPIPITIQGDSRQLSNVLRKVDSIIFSSPFASTDPTGVKFRYRRKGQDDRGKSLKFGKYAPSEHNIGNLRHGKIDTIITSPPFSEQNISPPSKQITKWWKKHRPKSCEVSSVCGRMTYSESKSNIGNLPHEKIDAIITSPPFSESDTAFHYQKDEWVAKKTRALKKVSNSKENIATLKHGEIDAIITSPPNGEAQQGAGIAKRGYQSSKYPPTILVGKRSYMPDKFKNEENISRQPHETYLSAMLKVYHECWKILKPNGKMVIHIKNFIRNKKVVRLDLDTIKLCEKVGFQLVERWYRQLKLQSFWRKIYMKKYPSAPKIHYEHILVFQKRA